MLGQRHLDRMDIAAARILIAPGPANILRQGQLGLLLEIGLNREFIVIGQLESVRTE